MAMVRMLYRRVASPLHERDLSADLDAVASSADEKDGSSVDEHNIEVSEDDASVGENAMQDSPVRGMQDPDYSPAPDSVRCVHRMHCGTAYICIVYCCSAELHLNLLAWMVSEMQCLVIVNSRLYLNICNVSGQYY